MKEFDEDVYKNLLFIRDCDDSNLEESLGTSFEVEVDNFGSLEAHELKPNGANILVSQENKHEYIELYLDWYFNISINKFFKPFYIGFYRVAYKEFLKIIDPQELELIICGTQELDFNQLKEGCTVGDGYTEESETVKHFWEVVLEYDDYMKKKFLFFLSGCDKAPIKGLASLNMVIGRYGPDSDKIPCAHTCFNFLLLPDYKDKEKLRQKLKIAVENSEGFGLS